MTDSERIADLERRVDNLEKLEREPDPFKWFPTVPAPTPHNPVGECSACGLKLYSTMGYVCNRSDCPTGLGPIMCNTHNHD